MKFSLYENPDGKKVQHISSLHLGCPQIHLENETPELGQIVW